MGARPLHLLDAGVVTEPRFAGLGAAPAALGGSMVERLRPAKRVRIPFQPRDRWLSASRETCRTLADAVGASLDAGALPVVVGGECTLVAGTITGALGREPDLILLYFDAHADFHTLATTPSHHVGGMCLAHVCGRTVAPLLWPGVRTIDDRRVALVGGRQLDAGESRNLTASRVTRIPLSAEHPDAPGLLAFVRRQPVWLHIDVDILDPSVMPAVTRPVPGGVALDALGSLLHGVAAVAEIRGLELCGYDPTRDLGGRLTGPLAGLVGAAVGQEAHAGR